MRDGRRGRDGRLLLLALAAVAQWSLGGTALVRAADVGDAPGRITVVDEVAVDDDVVRLADIARLEGPAAEKLGDLVIGRAPSPGRVRVVPGAGILATLRRSGVDLARVRYVIPQAVRVRRPGQEIAVATMRAIVDEYLGEAFSQGDRRVTLRRVDVPGPIRIPVGPYLTRVAPDGGAPSAGRTRLVVEILQHDQVVATVPVTAEVAVLEEVVVARRGIGRGAVIAPDDVVRERRNVSSLPRGTLTRLEDAVGMEASVPIAALTPLNPEQLVPPAVVRRGDVVLLIAETAGVRITTTGEVRQDAARGEQVRVLNMSSQTEVVGRAVDGQTVSVSQ
jgi:flagella basal body P-ring formation protein FlgA